MKYLVVNPETLNIETICPLVHLTEIPAFQGEVEEARQALVRIRQERAIARAESWPDDPACPKHPGTQARVLPPSEDNTFESLVPLAWCPEGHMLMHRRDGTWDVATWREFASAVQDALIEARKG